ncbi:hypothetical protein ACYOEI_17350 [Singulisphaera rosea]
MSSNEVENAARRRFNLGDWLFVMAGIALTLSLLRTGDWFARFPGRIRYWRVAIPKLLDVTPLDLTWGQTARDVLGQLAMESLGLLGSTLLGMMLIQLGMRLRQPRPAYSTLLRQPGFVVCTSMVVGVFLLIDFIWIARVDVPKWVIPTCALLLLWPTTGLPPWRPEASGIDRLGRVVGCGWVLFAAILYGGLSL